MGKVRIIGGTHRSRVLQFKDQGLDLRPTPDRVRETLFNWLGQDLTGKICLDLFSGSGALGFEALSRNAKFVSMNELNRSVNYDLHQNMELLKAQNVKITKQDALVYLKNCTEKFDVIFLDPPYKSNLLQPSLDLIFNNQILKKDGKIYIEYQVAPDTKNFTVLKSGKAGLVNFALLQYEESLIE